MAKRKSIRPVDRFDVFKRDAFTCQYCGKTPPTVVLEIDHIHPVSKGGENGLDNLITACFDCNRGKGANNLTTIPQTVAEKAAIIAEREAQLKAMKRVMTAKRRRETNEVREVEKAYQLTYPDRQFSDTFRASIRRNFLAFIPVDQVVGAMENACSRMKDEDRAVRYFCGICWRIRKQD